jgi:hypothetical protein
VLDLIKTKPSAAPPLTLRKAPALYANGPGQLLTCARDAFHLAIDDEFEDFDLHVKLGEAVMKFRLPGFRGRQTKDYTERERGPKMRETTLTLPVLSRRPFPDRRVSHWCRRAAA